MPSIGASQTVEQITGLAVFDANGKRVGPVVGTEGTPIRQTQNFPQDRDVWFTFETNNILVMLLVEPKGTDLFGMRFNKVFFASSDCSGDPLVQNPSSNTNPSLWPSFFAAGGPNPGQPGGGGDHIIYRADPNADELNGGGQFTAASWANVTSPVCNTSSFTSSHMIPLQAVLDIDTVFARPFHVGADVPPKKGQGPKK